MDNPFLQLLQQGQQGGTAPTPGMGMANALTQQAQASQGQAGAQPGMEPTEDVGQKGVTADSTKPLLQAMQALHGYIASSTDRGDIATVRSVMALLTQLVQKDQQRSAQMQQQGQGDQPMMSEE